MSDAVKNFSWILGYTLQMLSFNMAIPYKCPLMWLYLTLVVLLCGYTLQMLSFNMTIPYKCPLMWLPDIGSESLKEVF